MTAHLLRGFVLLLGASVVLAGCAGPGGEPSEDTRTASGDVTPAVSPAPSRSAPSSSGPSSSGPSSPLPSAASTRPPTALKATDLATGLTSPWGVLPLADGSIMVSERDTKKILRIRDGRASVLRTIDAARPGGEGGLLGLAMTADQRTVFTYVTVADDNRVLSMSWDGSRLGNPTTILDGIPKGGRHDGGGLAVGPDGYLFVGTGDSGNSKLSQDKRSLGGKVLRVTTDGRPAPGNPFDNEVFSYGHRNVEGLAFDDAGRLWASEFGEQTWDELNLIRRGANYGWPLVEGSGSGAGLTNPKVVWRTSEASPSGLAFWRGALWMAALRGSRLWQIPLDGTDVGTPKAHFTGTYGRLRGVAPTRDGEHLLLTTSNTDGRGDVRTGDDRLLQLTG